MMQWMSRGVRPLLTERGELGESLVAEGSPAALHVDGGEELQVVGALGDGGGVAEALEEAEALVVVVGLEVDLGEVELELVEADVVGLRGEELDAALDVVLGQLVAAGEGAVGGDALQEVVDLVLPLLLLHGVLEQDVSVEGQHAEGVVL